MRLAWCWPPQAMELRQAPKRSSAPGSSAHPHAIGFAAGTVEGIAWDNRTVVTEMIRDGRPGVFASKPSCDADYQRCGMRDLGASVHHVRYHPSSRNARKGGLRDDHASCPAACYLSRA